MRQNTTNNAVEASNKTFKYQYLNKVKRNKIAHLAAVVVEKLAPTTIRSDLYLLSNVFKIAQYEWGLMYPILSRE